MLYHLIRDIKKIFLNLLKPALPYPLVNGIKVCYLLVCWCIFLKIRCCFIAVIGNATAFIFYKNIYNKYVDIVICHISINVCFGELVFFNLCF